MVRSDMERKGTKYGVLSEGAILYKWYSIS